ncbi:MAG: hypothetical protein K8U57_06235 [Planctomycetes bacterium]|nr:hypothetical protein [Planctomycetota bacterium]
MSRTMFAVLLSFLLGCGSKSNSTQPSDEKPEPKVELTLTPVKASHEMDPAKHVIPTGPVIGRLVGVDVTADVHLEGKRLIFQKAEGAPGEPWYVSIELPSEPGREGSPSKMVRTPTDTPTGTAWSVNALFPKPVMFPTPDGAEKKWEPAERLGWTNGYAVTLEFGKRENGKLPGKIFLSLPDYTEAHPDTPKGSFLAGTFVVECARSPSDPPNIEAVPYVRGAINVRPEAPMAKLSAGYFGILEGPGRVPSGSLEVELDGGQSKRSNQDKPRIMMLYAGDGKQTPSYYEHSKLTPGRYLVFAGVGGGANAWKWVDVKAGGTITADLTVDGTQTGGLEVTAPLEAVSKVRLTPADEPGHPPLDEGLFEALAFHLGLEQQIVNRKALFKNLAPGRYEVRAAKQSRTVDVVAGKTVELDFEKK